MKITMLKLEHVVLYHRKVYNMVDTTGEASQTTARHTIPMMLHQIQPPISRIAQPKPQGGMYPPDTRPVPVIELEQAAEEGVPQDEDTRPVPVIELEQAAEEEGVPQHVIASPTQDTPLDLSTTFDTDRVREKVVGSVQRVIDCISNIYPALQLNMDGCNSNHSQAGKKRGREEGTHTPAPSTPKQTRKDEDIYYSDEEEYSMNDNSAVPSATPTPCPVHRVEIMKKSVGIVHGVQKKEDKDEQYETETIQRNREMWEVGHELAHIREMGQHEMTLQETPDILCNTQCSSCKELYSYMGSVCVNESRHFLFICRFCTHAETTPKSLLQHIATEHPLT